MNEEIEETEDTAREQDCGRTKDFGPWYDRLGAVRWGLWTESDPNVLLDLQAEFAGSIRFLLAPEQHSDGSWVMYLYVAPVPVSKNADFCPSSWSNFDKMRKLVPNWVAGYRACQRRHEEKT